MNRKLFPHHSHWGPFAVVEDGKVVGAVLFDFDPDPSSLIEAVPDSVHSQRSRALIYPPLHRRKPVHKAAVDPGFPPGKQEGG